MNKLLNLPLAETDPLIADAINNEVARQANGLELIASENFVSEAVLEALVQLHEPVARAICPAMMLTLEQQADHDRRQCPR